MTTTATYCTLKQATFAIFGPSKAVSQAEETMVTMCLNAAARQVDQYCDRPDGFALPATQTVRVFVPETYDYVFTDDIADANVAAITVQTDEDGDGVFEYTWRNTSPNAEFVLEPVNAASKGEGGPYTAIRACRSRTFPASYGAGFVAGGKRLVTPDMPLRGPGYRTPSVQVTAKWGWPTVPSGIKDATIQQVIYLYKSFSAPFGLSGAGDAGEVRMLGDQLHPTARSLCYAYRRSAAGVAV